MNDRRQGISAYLAITFLVVSFAWPSINYFVYYALCGSITILLILKTPPTKSQMLLWSQCALVFCIFSAPKLIAFNSASDLKELAKPLLFISICLLATLSLSKRDIANTLLSCLAIDFLFTVLQWNQFDRFGFAQINSWLHPEHHIEGSLALSSVRALGIFADTAEHSAIMLIVYCYFLANLRYGVMRARSLLGAVLSAMILVLTQSKTGFIAFLALLPVAYYCIAHSYSVLLLNIFSAFFAIILYNYIPELGVDSVEQYYRLFELGLSVSSFDERLAIWKSVMQISFESNPLLLLFGPGRGALERDGLQSSVFDNDVVYVINAYGILGLALILLLYVYTLQRLSRMKISNGSWLKYVLVVTPLVGFATDFLSSLKVLVFLAIVSTVTFNISKKQ